MSVRKRKRDSMEETIPTTMGTQQSEHGTTDANAVRAYAQGLASRTCTRCNSKLLEHEQQIVKLFKDIIGTCTNEATDRSAFDGSPPRIGKHRTVVHFRCPRCGQQHCIGCGIPFFEGPAEQTITTNGLDLSWHCDNARLVLIWAILCGYDSESKHNQQPPVPHPSNLPSQARKKTKSAGVGYGSDDYYGDLESPPLPSLSSGSSFSLSSGTIGHLTPTNIPPTPHIPLQPAYAQAIAEMHAWTAAQIGAMGHMYPTPPSAVPAPPLSGYYPPAPAPPPTMPEVRNMDFSFPPSSRMTMPPPSAPTPPPHPTALSGTAAAGIPGGDAAPPFDDWSFGLIPRRVTETPWASSTDPDDALSTRTMTVLSLLLPSVQAGQGRLLTPFDHAPPAVLASMILESCILSRVGDLLRNENLDDIMKRARLYESVLRISVKLASHRGTADRTMLNSRWEVAGKQNLLRTSFQRQMSVVPRKYRETNSIASCLTNLSTQAALMLRSVTVKGETTSNVAEREMFSMCRRIVELARTLGLETHGEEQNNAAQWQEVPDDEMLENHAFAREATSMKALNRTRLRALLKDVNILKTSLPPGIFLRYANSRPDLMKILIIGPEGTPYAHGVFEFDLLCSADYPESPPKMLFKTTGGGTARMNPNLYKDGKVCLSLLGTWEGEPWLPRQSTILQLLISIQAMILCEEPYCNEPGYGREGGTERSKAYNRQLYPLTIQHGMLDWLARMKKVALSALADFSTGIELETMPPHELNGNGIWGDVIREHFAANEANILATVANWVDDKPPKKKPVRSIIPAPASDLPEPYSLAEWNAAHPLFDDDDAQAASDLPEPYSLVDFNAAPPLFDDDDAQADWGDIMSNAVLVDSGGNIGGKIGAAEKSKGDPEMQKKLNATKAAMKKAKESAVPKTSGKLNSKSDAQNAFEKMFVDGIVSGEKMDGKMNTATQFHKEIDMDKQMDTIGATMDQAKEQGLGWTGGTFDNSTGSAQEIEGWSEKESPKEVESYGKMDTKTAVNEAKGQGDTPLVKGLEDALKQLVPLKEAKDRNFFG